MARIILLSEINTSSLMLLWTGFAMAIPFGLVVCHIPRSVEAAAIYAFVRLACQLMSH